MVAGLSGAGVYRVDADGQPYVLKISDKSEPAERWRRKLQIQQLAADAGLAPPIVQTDEVRRAVGLDTPFVVPPFVLEAIHWGLTEKPPAPDRPEVLSHNDVNPSNLVYDGVHLMLLDWEVAGRNDPYYDLGAIAVFFRMDAETCRRLIEIHDGKPLASLPARFLYVRRFVATLLGAMFMRLVRASGHAGAAGTETPDSALSLSEFYQAMRAGTLNIATGEGQAAFGMALIKECVAI